MDHDKIRQTGSNIRFSKFEGTGNDFIAINNISMDIKLSIRQLLHICNRKTGVGADGVLELQKSILPGCAYKLVYYNADGKEGSLCGNGSRCSIAFAQKMGVINCQAGQREITFEACDGVHIGGFFGGDRYFVDMSDVSVADVDVIDDDNYFLDTGSPHHVTFVSGLQNTDISTEGKELRWTLHQPAGANINFVEKNTLHQVNTLLEWNASGTAKPSVAADDVRITVRTFERGVENETLSCGTGAVASAIAAYIRHSKKGKERAYSDVRKQMTKTQVSMPGGVLEVSFSFDGVVFSNIRLSGPANHVFDGVIEIREA